MAQYLTYAEYLDQGLPAEALANLSQSTVEKALIYASSKCNSYIKKRHALPLVNWAEDLREATCDIASWRLMRRRGFRPGSGADETIVKAYDDAIAWLKLVAKGEVELDGQEDQTVDLDEEGPLAESEHAEDFHFFTSDGSE
jgi:phage gp36-like protein